MNIKLVKRKVVYKDKETNEEKSFWVVSVVIGDTAKVEIKTKDGADKKLLLMFAENEQKN